MTLSEVYEQESKNSDRIYLYPVGGFYRAYEHSAFFFNTQIKNFVVSKRFVKTINHDLVSLGFPINSLKKWTWGYNIEVAESGKVSFPAPKKDFDELEFEQWRDAVILNAADQYTPNTAMITKAPVYKNAYDLLTQIYSFSKNISKNANNPLGSRLKTLSYELAYIVRTLYDNPDVSSACEEGMEKCKEIEYILQVLNDLREISEKSFALSCERVVSVSKQLNALRAKVKA